MRGKIICLEGIDGAGKRTQAALLSKALKRSGVRAKVYSYPDYSSEYGKIIDQYLHGHLEIGRMEHFMLFLMDIMKDRSRMQEELEDGNVLIMDRYVFTAAAYICPSGLEYRRAKEIIGLMRFIRPSRVFYLDMPAELTAGRKGRQNGELDKFERNRKFLQEVKGVYERMLSERYMCSAWIRIDASKSIAQVHRSILDRMAGQ